MALVPAQALLERYSLTRLDVRLLMECCKYEFWYPQPQPPPDLPWKDDAAPVSMREAILLIDEDDVKEWIAAKAARALERDYDIHGRRVEP